MDETAPLTIQRIAIFPLPGAVLFPGLHLPLHIFEPRYSAMVQEVLARDRQNLAQDTQLSIRGFGARATFGWAAIPVSPPAFPRTPFRTPFQKEPSRGTASRPPLADAGDTRTATT